MTRLITILLVGFLSFSCMAFQETWKPGEGQVRLNTKSQLRFDAGNYEVFVLMDVTMKYRFTTLLGDHVELFIPKYDVEQVKVYKKGSNNEIFTVFLRGSWNGQRIEKINEGDSPNFHVSPEIMSNFQMMSLDFRLQKSSEHLIDRRFPGYLRGAGLWGWDVPGSKRWEDVFSFYKVNAVKAKEVWLKMKKEPEPIIYGDLLDATFSVYGLMAAIARQIPNAFKSSKDVSPAFAQMASLKGQLVQAEDSRAPDLARRRELTDKAWRLLKDEMSTEERQAIDRITPYGFDDSITEELENLFTLVEKDYADDEKLTKANQDRLTSALSLYTPTKLKQLRLPSKVYTELSRLASGGVNWKELVVKRDSKSGKYGYQDKTGKWVVNPVYTSAKEFEMGVAIVRDTEDRYMFINARNVKVSDYLSDFRQLPNSNLACVKLMGKNGDWGLLNTGSGNYIVPAKKGNGCTTNGNEKKPRVVTAVLKSGSTKTYTVWSPSGKKVFVQDGIAWNVNYGTVGFASSVIREIDRCGYKGTEYRGKFYDYDGNRILPNRTSFKNGVSELCLTKQK